MKKIVYGILVCIIILGIILTLTIGFNVGFPYKKSVSIDIYIGQKFDSNEIKQIAKEVFDNKNIIIQKVELFEDMVSITTDEMSEELLNEKIENLNTKLNEKYGIDNKVSNITVRHSPKIKLISTIKPYIIPIITCTILVLIYVVIRYKQFGIIKMVLTYLGVIIGIELLYASIIIITRLPVTRIIVPIGLVIYLLTLVALGIINEKKIK